MLKGFLYVAIICCMCTGAQAQQFTIRTERNGAVVYLIASGVPGAGDSCSKKLPDSGGLSIICGTPVYPGSVSFFFADSDLHVYTAREATPAAFFAVLLRGSTKLSSYKRPTWGILTYRDRAYGDTVLLRKLLTKQLVRIEYSRAEIVMDHGKEIWRYQDAVVMKISHAEAEDIRRQLKAL